MQPEGDLDKWKTGRESSEHLRIGSQKRALNLRLKILMPKKARSLKDSWERLAWSDQYAVSNKKLKHAHLWKMKINLFVGRTLLPYALK